MTESSIYLTTEEAARSLKISAKTLCNWRSSGGGPPFCKFGSSVRYKLGDLDLWAESRRQSHTR